MLYLLALYPVISGITFMAYALDKAAARQRRWRTPESTLHLLSLLGGWPGAWLAQHLLHHKSKKLSFQLVYWLTVIIHCAALGGLIFASSG